MQISCQLEVRIKVAGGRCVYEWRIIIISIALLATEIRTSTHVEAAAASSARLNTGVNESSEPKRLAGISQNDALAGWELRDTLIINQIFIPWFVSFCRPIKASAKRCHLWQDCDSSSERGWRSGSCWTQCLPTEQIETGQRYPLLFRIHVYCR